VLGALSGSQQVAPNIWVDTRNRVSYQINAQAPQYDVHSLDDFRNLPILGGTSGQAQIVANVASISRATTSPVEDHYNIRPLINIYGGADGEDLGYVSDHIFPSPDAPKIARRAEFRPQRDAYYSDIPGSGCAHAAAIGGVAWRSRVGMRSSGPMPDCG
jgi:multidrug efflux pump subunit AcrB